MIVKQAQEPSLEPTIHEMAKPVARTLAWSATALAALALAAATVRTAREG